MTTPLLEVSGVSKHFPISGGPLGIRTIGNVRAVDDVSFTIGHGETLALVGESGCGKTTTARVILRLRRPSSGRVNLDGRDVHALKGADVRWFRKTVQAVFQDPWSSLSPRMRVANIVAEPLVINERLSRREIRERVYTLLERVGLNASHGKLFPHEFSGGQRQRIALASALITQPQLVVLDEPVSALDVSVQAQVMNLLKEIQAEQGASFLLITHDLATVRYIATRVAVMYLGQVVEEAPTAELLDNPKHPYTTALLGSSLPAHPDLRRDDARITGEMPSPLDPPNGCRFRTRCPFAMAICEELPAARVVGRDHTAACHLY